MAFWLTWIWFTVSISGVGTAFGVVSTWNGTPRKLAATRSEMPVGRARVCTSSISSRPEVPRNE